MIKFTKEMKREIEIFLFLPYHDMTIYYIYLRYREYIYNIYKIHYKVSLKKKYCLLKLTNRKKFEYKEIFFWFMLPTQL